MLTNFLVMGFPFITMIERKERQNTLDNINKKVGEPRKPLTLPPVPKSSEPSKNETDCRELTHDDMICLSNLEDVAFYTVSTNCLLDEINPNRKKKKYVDYDKYLDFFE